MTENLNLYNKIFKLDELAFSSFSYSEVLLIGKFYWITF